MPVLHTKLKHDAIIEAVFEIRFDPGSELPEIVIGRLADASNWAGFTARRLPIADFPHAIRMADQNLIRQPLIELKNPQDGVKIKAGTHVLVCNMPKPYQGWDAFHALHIKAIDILFASVPSAQIKRLGLRYINVIDPDLHKIASISELKIAVAVGPHQLTDNYNVNFRIKDNDQTHCQVRVATKGFVNPPLKGAGHTIIDIDVYTPSEVKLTEADQIKRWLPHAREVKNKAFFDMFSEAQIAQMERE